MEEVVIWYWFRCSECNHTWGSEQPNPDREWCSQGCIDFPEFTHEEVDML